MEVGQSVPSAQYSYYDEEINLVEIFQKLWKHRMSIIIIFLVMTLSALILSILSPRMYKAGTTLLINISGIKAYTEDARLRTTSAPQNISVLKAILASRSMREKVVKKGDLLPVFFEKLWDKKKEDWKPGLEHVPNVNDGAGVLRTMVSIVQARNNPTLTIEASYHDPAYAARIANLYVDTLEGVLKTNTFSVVKKNRLFLEQQVSEVKRNIEQLEEKLKDLQQRHNIYDLELQSKASVEAYTNQLKQLTEYELELQNLLKITTHQNPQVAQLNSQIEMIRPYLQQLREGISVAEESNFKKDSVFAAGHNLDDQFIPLKLLPHLRIQYTRLEREKANQRKIYDLLVDAYEKAKIQEAKQDIYFTVLDKAVTPKKPFKPKTKRDVLLAALAGLFIGIFQAFFQEYISTARERLKDSDESKAGIPTDDLECPEVGGDIGNQSTSKGDKQNV